MHRGAGVDVLATLPGPYDVAFIDADKATYPDYTRLALERLRPGGMVIADNAIRRGRIVEAGVGADIDGIRAMHDLLAADSEPRRDDRCPSATGWPSPSRGAEPA